MNMSRLNMSPANRSHDMTRDACPSIDQPMETGDGLLVRLSPRAGYFTPAEFVAIAEAAAECGNGIMEVSSRGNLQVRGLSADSAQIFKSRIGASEIDLSRGVPISCNPLAGFDVYEIIDPRELRDALHERLENSDLVERLNPKVSIIIDSGGRFNLSSVIGDIRLRAVNIDGMTRWKLFTGRTEARSKYLGILPDYDGAAGAVMALLERIAGRNRSGNSNPARGQDLQDVDFTGIASFLCPEQDISPGRVNADDLASPGSPVGIFPLKSGEHALGVALAYGTADARQLLMLARDAEGGGATRIEPATGKTILISEMGKAEAIGLQKSLEHHGFVVDSDDPRLKIVTCAGAPSCKSGFIKTRELAAEITREFGSKLSSAVVADLCIHITACEKRCADPRRPTLEILGGEGRTQITHDGLSQFIDSDDQLMPAIGKLLKKQKI